MDTAVTAVLRRALPGLDPNQITDVAEALDRIIAGMGPSRVYAFGSQPRGAADTGSDVDLLIVLAHSEQPSYRRAQDAYRLAGAHLVPLDLVVYTAREFEERRSAPGSLPATAEREGQLVYAR